VAYAYAFKILDDNQDILHSMSDALMKYETIDSKQIDQLMARESVDPPEDWGSNSSTPGDSDDGPSGNVASTDDDKTVTSLNESPQAT